VKVGLIKADYLMLGWTALVIIVVAYKRAIIPDSEPILRHHATFFFVYLGVVRLVQRFRPTSTFIYLSRFLLLAAFPFVTFFSIGNIIEGLNPYPKDLFLLELDKKIFGFDPSVEVERIWHPIPVEILQTLYFSYLPLPIILFVLLLWRKDFDYIDKTMTASLLCLFITYIGYMLMPARSPYVAQKDPMISWAFAFTSEPKGLLLTGTLRQWLDEWDRLEFNAFPSGHTALSLVYMLVLGRHRVVRWLVFPCCLGIILATVYLRYHYVVDVLAGFCVGLLAFGIGRLWIRFDALQSQKEAGYEG
jgi:membrane-associated phospholipid phosphatase